MKLKQFFIETTYVHELIKEEDDLDKEIYLSEFQKYINNDILLESITYFNDYIFSYRTIIKESRLFTHISLKKKSKKNFYYEKNTLLVAESMNGFLTKKQMIKSLHPLKIIELIQFLTRDILILVERTKIKELLSDKFSELSKSKDYFLENEYNIVNNNIYDNFLIQNIEEYTIMVIEYNRCYFVLGFINEKEGLTNFLDLISYHPFSFLSNRELLQKHKKLMNYYLYLLSIGNNDFIIEKDNELFWINTCKKGE